MRNSRVNTMIARPSHSFSKALLLLASLCLLGCGSDTFYPSGLTGDGSTPGITTAYFYTVNATNNTVLQFRANGSGSATQTSASITLPAGFNASLLATDATGQLYVGGYTTGPNASEVLVYSGVTTAPMLARTVILQPGKLTALAADSTGQIYAAQSNASPTVNVYPAATTGTSTPIRSLTQSDYLYVNDLAVDASGNLYVCAYNGGIYLVDVFNSAATGSVAPLRTLQSGVGSYFGGIAVDAAGELYVLEQLTIEKFAPGASGSPTPLNSINLPTPPAPYTGEAYSNVLRLDTAGNLFVPTTLSNTSASQNIVYAFSANQAGTPTPILQFVPTGATASTPLGINIPLAVF
ncbi:MAG: hypothetical protein V4555_00250 [Acidobacteriota bacterium]